jgi:hypothetical protein
MRRTPPPSLNQALDFLKDKVDCDGNPIKVSPSR